MPFKGDPNAGEICLHRSVKQDEEVILPKHPLRFVLETTRVIRQIFIDIFCISQEYIDLEHVRGSIVRIFIECARN